MPKRERESGRERERQSENVRADMNVNLSLKMATATVRSRHGVSGVFPLHVMILSLPCRVIKGHRRGHRSGHPCRRLGERGKKYKLTSVAIMQPLLF